MSGVTRKITVPYSVGKAVAAMAAAPFVSNQLDISPDRAGQQAQQSALRQQLPDNPHPARSQREPHAQFTLARRGARQLQAGDIGARNHQHHSHRQHDQKYRVPNLAELLS